MKRRALLFLLFLIFFLNNSFAKGVPALIFNGYDARIGFIDQSKNILQGDLLLLNDFYEKLYQLKINPDKSQKPISIFHLGDSHLQAGFLNGTVMQNFHRDFGNAGRGLIFPLKLANTNEPSDYDIVSTSPWRSCRCVSSKMAFPVGIGGLGIQARGKDINFTVKTTDVNNCNYSFNCIKLFHHPKAARLNIAGQNLNVVFKETNYPFISEYDLDHAVSEVEFNGCSVLPDDSNVYYGLSLENGKNGVLYHAVGLNGAQFMHYRKIVDFDLQIKSIAPNIIIFSLGTNEAFRGKIVDSQIEKEIASLVEFIKKENHHATIIFTTPAECQRKVSSTSETLKFEPNSNILIVRNAIINYARKNNCIYWDLFDIAGGIGSSEKWIESNLLARDRIHFKVSGYRVQGNLFYQAIIKGYNQYVASHH